MDRTRPGSACQPRPVGCYNQGINSLLVFQSFVLGYDLTRVKSQLFSFSQTTIVLQLSTYYQAFYFDNGYEKQWSKLIIQATPTEDYTLCFFRVVQHSIPPIINYYYMKDQWTLVCEGEAFCVFFFGRREAFSV